MILVRHELRRGLRSLLIWTVCIGAFIAICVMLFPEIKDQMEAVREMYASMGAFTQAFGMDRIDMGTLIGFYTVECGTILGLGGGLYAAMIGASALAKEEKEHTAEFLLTHPVRRSHVVTEKLLAVWVQLCVLHAVVFGVAVGTSMMIGEEIAWKEMLLLHGANMILHLEISGICFGVSAFLRQSGTGIGLGIGAFFYFLNLVANISQDAEWLKYITPFGYADGAELLSQGYWNGVWMALGCGYMSIALILGYFRYITKDIRI